MSKHLDVLESAIADCGWWRWWTADLPRVFQIELGGTQLWSPPPAPNRPPSGVIAVRLFGPKKITLLAREDGFDWVDALHADALDPGALGWDRLTLSSHERAAAFEAGANGSREWWRSADSVADTTALVPVAFWAGLVGLSALCESIEIANQLGPLSPEATARPFGFPRRVRRRAAPRGGHGDRAGAVGNRIHGGRRGRGAPRAVSRPRRGDGKAARSREAGRDREQTSVAVGEELPARARLPRRRPVARGR